MASLFHQLLLRQLAEIKRSGLVAALTAAGHAPFRADGCLIEPRQMRALHHNVEMQAAADDDIKTRSAHGDFLPLVNDYARNENVQAQKEIHTLITEVYESLPFPVIHVPVLQPGDRVDFILKDL